MTPGPISIEQLRQLHDAMQRDLERIQILIEMIQSLPEDAKAEDMLRVLLEISRKNLLAQSTDIRQKLDALRPAMANIVLAAPVPGGARS